MPRKVKCANCGITCHSKSDLRLCRKCFNLKNRENSKFKSRAEYAKNWQLSRKYDIDLDGLYLLWVAFKGKCQICGVTMTMPKSGRGQIRSSCCIDHDHRTGNIRALLCNSCNKAIGLFNDDPSIVKNAFHYLGGNYAEISYNQNDQ